MCCLYRDVLKIKQVQEEWWKIKPKRKITSENINNEYVVCVCVCACVCVGFEFRKWNRRQDAFILIETVINEFYEFARHLYYMLEQTMLFLFVILISYYDSFSFFLVHAHENRCSKHINNYSTRLGFMVINELQQISQSKETIIFYVIRMELNDYDVTWIEEIQIFSRHGWV